MTKSYAVDTKGLAASGAGLGALTLIVFMLFDYSSEPPYASPNRDGILAALSYLGLAASPIGLFFSISFLVRAAMLRGKSFLVDPRMVQLPDHKRIYYEELDKMQEVAASWNNTEGIRLQTKSGGRIFIRISDVAPAHREQFCIDLRRWANGEHGD